MATKYPSIPEPSADVDSLLASVQALKEAVEMLTNTRGKGMSASRNFVKTNANEQTPVGLQDGDILNDLSVSPRVSYVWFSGGWV